MNWLIVTVTSLALAAALSLSAIWYGGQAYSSANATAQATTMVAQAEQIAAAVRLWSVDNGGSQSYAGLVGPNNYCRLVGTDLTNGGYIQSIPGQAFHSSLCGGFAATYYSAGTWSLDATNYADCGVNFQFLVAEFGNSTWETSSCNFPSFTTDPAKICNAINNMQGVTSIPNHGWSDFQTALGNHSFICAGGHGGSNAGSYEFIYRIF